MTSPKENAPVLAGTQGADHDKLIYCTGRAIGQQDALRSGIRSLRRSGAFASIATGRAARRALERLEQRRRKKALRIAKGGR